MPQDKIDLLYKDLQGEYELGSIDDFKTYLSDDKKRELFFNEIVKPRYDVSDIGTFENVYGLKKKEPLVLGFESATEASRIGGLQKPEKLSQSPLKTAATTTPSVSTRKWTSEQQKALIEGIKTGNLSGQTTEEDDYLGRIGDRIVRGMNTLNQNLAKTPEFIYNIAAIPQNIIAEQFDIPSLSVSADKVKKDLGITNQVADYYKDQVNQLAYLDEKYMGANGSVTSLIKSGNYKDAAKLLGEQIAESLPTTAAIAASGGLGATPSAITLGGGAVFGAAKYDELADRTDLSESEKTAISLSTGLVEGLIENIGTANLGRVAKEIFAKQGADIAKDEIKKTFTTAYKEALKKYMPISGVVSEGIEEAATQFAENAIDIYGGVDPNKKLTDGVMDALLVGMGSGAVISSPTLLSKKRNEQAKSIQSEVEQIDADIQNPNISEQAKASLVEARQERMTALNDVLQEDVEQQKAIPEESKREIEALQEEVNNIEVDIEQVTNEAGRKVLEGKKEQIENRIEQLSNEITNGEQATTIEEETIETPSSETVTDTIVSDGSATPTTVESTEVVEPNVPLTNEVKNIESVEGIGVEPTEKVVSETVSDIEPPVVEQTTTDVGGVTTPDVSEALKDVDSTAKALEGKDTAKIIKVEWVNKYGQKGVSIQFEKEYIPKSKIKETQADGSILLSTKTKEGENVYVEIQEHKETLGIAEGKGKGKGTYYIRGNIGNRNITKSNLSIEDAKSLAYKILDIAASDKKIRSVILRDETPQSISEAYHKAKADGSNPELVKAVEDLLGAKESKVITEPTKQVSESATEFVGVNLSDASETKPSESARKSENLAVSKKERVTKRKAIAEAKIDEIADKAKQFADKYLKSKGIDNIQKSGFGDQNKVVDVLANTVKTLVNAGIEIDEAIREVRAYFDAEYDTSGIQDYEIKQSIARDELTDYAKEQGFTSYKHALNAVKRYVREVGREDVITKEDIDKAKEAKAELEKGSEVEEVTTPIQPPPTKKEVKSETKANKTANEAFETEDNAVKAIVKAIKRSEGYDEATKQALSDKIGEYYITESHDELQKIAKRVVEELGGADKAFAEMTTNTNIPANIKVAVLGEVLIEYKQNQDKAKTETEKKEWVDKQADLYEYLDPYIREAGRAISYMQKIYAASPLAMLRREQKKLEDRNKLNKPLINQKVAYIKEIFENDEDTKEAINEALESALGESKETITALEKEIEKLRKEIAKKQGAKGSSTNPIKVRLTSNEEAAKRLKKIFTKTYSNPFLNPEFWQDMTYIGVNAIENGFVKVGEFYNFINKTLKGKYKDAYGEVYRRAKAEAIAQGASENDFTSDADIETEINEIQKLSDAEKLTKLTALKAKLAIQAVENKLNTSTSAKAMAERIKSLIPQSGNIWLKYQKGIVNGVVNKLNKTTTSTQTPILQSFASLVSKEINQKLSELIPSNAKEKNIKNQALILADIAKNQEKFAEIYEKALAKIKEEYSDNQKAIQVLEKMLEDNDLSKPFSKKAIQDTINSQIKKIGETLKSIAFEDGSSVSAYKDKVVNGILALGNYDAETEQLVREMVSTEFDKMLTILEGETYRETAKRITQDLANLNQPSTTNEKDALSKIISIVKKKASEYKSDKGTPISTNLADVIKFAITNKEKGQTIYELAQKEVFEQIDNNKDLTDAEKENMLSFLENYKNSVFDILLTRGQKDKIIREKLIELGYAKQVNGKVVLDILPLIGSEKSLEKAIDKVVDSISKETGISKEDLKDFKDAILIRAKELVAEKKLSELNKYLKTKERYRAARLIGNKKRKTRVEKLMELYNAGGLRNKDVMRELSEDLGIITFTEQEEQWLEKQFEKINDAPIGAEREILEEELQAFLETKSGDILGNALWDRMRSRMLSGPLTAIKNLSGFFDTAIMGIEKILKTNKHLLNPLKWKQGVDLNTFKVLFKARNTAINTALDILVNGGVDMGTAFSETTMTKEGTPRVRYIEYDKKSFLPNLYVKIGGYKFNLNMYNSLRNKEYVIGRFLAFVDTFNQIALGEMKAYSYLKNQYLLNDPSLSEKQASQKAYDDLYNIDIAKAKVDVALEFAERGIELDMNKKSDVIRFNRRVYESVAQKRSSEVIQESSEFANRYTYKQHDMGVFPVMATLMTYVKSVFPFISAKLKKYGDKNPSTKWATDAVAGSIEIFGEAIFTTHMPFIQGVSNILEKGIELFPPYGYAKSVGYGVGAIVSKVKKDAKSTEQLASKSGEMMIRASMGLLITSILMSMADDDEDDGIKALYGSGDEDFRKQAAIKTVRPQNTIVIMGRRINLDYLGSVGVSLKAKAALMDLERYSEKYKKLSDEDKYYAQMAAMSQTLMMGSYTQGIYDLINRSADVTYASGKISELATRVIIPFTSASRQAYSMANPEATRPVNFKEQLAKYSGLVAGWTVDRPAFDFLGDTYETGDLYTGSPDAFLKMLGAMQYSRNNNLARRILSSVNYDVGFTKIKATDEKYYIFDAETGKQRAMTAEEEYNVNFETAKEFKNLVTEFFDRMDTNEDFRNIYSTDDRTKKEIRSLHSDAKYKAFEKLFNEVPMSLEKEKELQDLKNQLNDNTN